MRFLKLLSTAKTWKTFVFEVAVIVVGVGIALSAEQLLSQYNNKKAANAAHEHIVNDLYRLQINMLNRLAIAPCTKQRIESLETHLMEREGLWSPPPRPFEETFTKETKGAQFIPLPFSDWPDGTWQSALESGAASYMKTKDFSILSTIFESVATIKTKQNTEAELIGALHHLAHSSPMSYEERRNVFSTLGKFGAANEYIESLSRQIVRLIQKVMSETQINREDFSSGKAANQVRQLIEESTPRKLYPSCYDESQWVEFLEYLDGFVEER